MEKGSKVKIECKGILGCGQEHTIKSFEDFRGMSITPFLKGCDGEPEWSTDHFTVTWIKSGNSLNWKRSFSSLEKARRYMHLLSELADWTIISGEEVQLLAGRAYECRLLVDME